MSSGGDNEGPPAGEGGDGIGGGGIGGDSPPGSSVKEPRSLYTTIYVLTGVFGAIFIIGPLLVRRGPNKGNYGVSPLHQLLLTLRFYALGTMLISVADFVGVSKSTAGRIVRDISSAIARLYDKYIIVTTNSAEKFYRIAEFPRVLGAIDCTHIRIQSPCQLIGEEFRNRKNYFSINVQGVCDADLKFMNVVARWPGSAHDATIFNNSTLRAQCDIGQFGNRWLLGDSAYPNRPYLLTPLLNPRTEAENRYNEAHIKTRNTIERIVRCCIMMTAFCMWILWVTVYIAQMNPIMSPRVKSHILLWLLNNENKTSNAGKKDGSSEGTSPSTPPDKPPEGGGEEIEGPKDPGPPKPPEPPGPPEPPEPPVPPKNPEEPENPGLRSGSIKPQRLVRGVSAVPAAKEWAVAISKKITKANGTMYATTWKMSTAADL